MAGGPSTPELAIAVCEAGGLGFLAAGYKRADAVRDEIRAVRAATSAPFGVNVFVPAPEPADPAALRNYLDRLAPEADRQGAELGEPRFDDDDWEAKLDALCDDRPAVASFTFGCPDAPVVERLHGGVVAVWVTVTNVEEALAAPTPARTDSSSRAPRPAVIAAGSSTTARTRAGSGCSRCCGWSRARRRCRWSRLVGSPTAPRWRPCCAPARARPRSAPR